MGIFRVFWSLLFPPHYEFLPVPEDWPPDGSLHFLECVEEAQKSISNTRIQYEFSSNVGEDDRRLLALSMELIRQFCDSRQVLTRIISGAEFSPKQRHPSERFTVRYRRFLEHLGSPISATAPDERTLLLLTKGFDATAFWGSQDISTTDACFFDFYAFPKECAFTDAKSAVQAVDAGKYDVWFNLSEWGPCALYITLNPATVDVAALEKIVAAVCEENNILLQNP